MIVRLIAWLLKRDLSEKDMLVLSNAVMHRLGALPIRGSMYVDDNLRIIVNGKPLDSEQTLLLRNSARIVLDSMAYKLVRDQVKFSAVEHGFHKAESPLQQLWARAALWHDQEQEQLLKALSQDSSL